MMKRLLPAALLALLLSSPATQAQTDDQKAEALNAVSFYLVAAHACREENGGAERYDAALTASMSLLFEAGATTEEATAIVDKLIGETDANTTAPKIDPSTCPTLTDMGSEKVKAVSRMLAETKPSTPSRP